MRTKQHHNPQQLTIFDLLLAASQPLYRKKIYYVKKPTPQKMGVGFFRLLLNRFFKWLAL